MGKNLFFYGTLRHVPLLEIVLGRKAEQLSLMPDTLSGHVVLSVMEGPFPSIVPRVEQQAAGLLVRGLDAQDIERLDFYEGSFEYDLHHVTLQSGETAEVYMCGPDQWALGGAWSLEAWQATWGALSCFAAQEVMGYFGERDRASVAKLFPRIRARAAAKVNAQGSLHGAGTFRGQVEVLKRRMGYSKFYALEDLQLRHERFDGTMSDTLDRAVFIGNDAAIVLPYDPVRDCVMLVEQVRMGPLARGDKTLWQLEPVAGGIDPGETPQEAARREAQEEAGIALGHLEKIAEIYASPGNATEFFYVFIGLADLPDAAQGTGGLETEHEDIRSHILPFDDFLAMVDNFEATNAPLVVAGNWLARHRDRLRSAPLGATPDKT